MIIKTRKLPATSHDGERMRATAANGATLTVPFPYGETEPYAWVAGLLARAYGYAPAVEHVSGQTYRANVDVMIIDEVAHVIAEHAGVDADTARSTAKRLV